MTRWIWVAAALVGCEDERAQGQGDTGSDRRSAPALAGVWDVGWRKLPGIAYDLGASGFGERRATDDAPDGSPEESAQLEWVVTDELLEVRFTTGELCGPQWATYRYTLEADRVLFEVIDEPCSVRRADFGVSAWTREG
jgi:hypothetical protein